MLGWWYMVGVSEIIYLHRFELGLPIQTSRASLVAVIISVCLEKGNSSSVVSGRILIGQDN